MRNKAQTFVEYAMLVIILTAALLGMLVFFKRSIQGNYRQGADVIGEGEQFAKNNTVVIDRSPPGEDVTDDDDPPSGCPGAVARVIELQNELYVKPHTIKGSVDPITGLPTPDTSVIGLVGLQGFYQAQYTAQNDRLQLEKARLIAAGVPLDRLTQMLAAMQDSVDKLKDQADELQEQVKDKEDKVEELMDPARHPEFKDCEWVVLGR